MEENKKPRLELMLDMETVSLRENAGILGIAIKPFFLDGRKCDEKEIYSNIDLASCYMAGMDMNGCQEWWMEQSAEARNHHISSGTPKELIHSATIDIYNHLYYLAETYELYIWSRGIDFDVPKLEWCFRKFVDENMEMPYKPWAKRDVRTYVKEIPGFDEHQIEFEGTKHIAFCDAAHQIKVVQAAYKFINK